MNIDHIVIVLTEQKSIFLEILFKYFQSKHYKSNKKKITLVGSLSHVLKEAKKYKFKYNFNEVSDISESKKYKINVKNLEPIKKKLSKLSKNQISNNFNETISFLKKNKNVALMNGPINKKSFLKKKYLGVTEYLAKKTNSKNPVMLIYNNKISVSPITTHLPIKHVANNLNKSKIIKNIKLINNFYKKNFNFKPKIAVLGLNPHCETIERVSEEQRIITPAIYTLKKQRLSVDGPFSADSILIKNNLMKYYYWIAFYKSLT